MLAAGIIGILVLLLIYFALRIQTLQQEVTSLRSSTKSQTIRANQALSGLGEIVLRLQQVYAKNIETAAAKGLISGQQQSVLRFLTTRFTDIVMDCWQHSNTTEEAVNRQLNNHNELTMEDLRAFLQQQPSQVRMAWAKNTPEGFISACETLSYAAVGKPPQP
ncbi:hypothetical protein IT774_16875 [Salinimonas marina]|uniref:Uncharacterized protein n=1 Tax=Salinimonas marina TaxID=2785918 RepID=A0A7S9HD05_9ALTE|nr:hypothetical protein [Salinimonas marina]QPG05705.1 hypothetical protein IT774_16875 [Salinimonas marina]